MPAVRPRGARFRRTPAPPPRREPCGTQSLPPMCAARGALHLRSNPLRAAMMGLLMTVQQHGHCSPATRAHHIMQPQMQGKFFPHVSVH